MTQVFKELKIRWRIFRDGVWLFFRNYAWKDNVVPFQRIKCPVCGTRTLDSYWICPRCHWAYEDFCEEYPDLPSDSNGEISLNEYKEKYKISVHSDSPLDL